MRRLLAALVLVLAGSVGWAQTPGFIHYYSRGGTISAPLLAPAADNCAAVPYSFTGDTNTGVCSAAADTVGFITGGTTRLSVSTTAVTSTLPILASTVQSAAALNLNSYGAANWTMAGELSPTTNGVWNIGNTTARLLSIYVNAGIQGGKSKSLTDAAAAVTFASVAVPTNGQVAGEVIWAATSSAAAVRFVANGSVRWWGVDEGGTPVCGINAIGTAGEGHSSGANTLVCTLTNVVATTNCAIQVTCTNDTAGTDPITFYGRFNMPITATITFP